MKQKLLKSLRLRACMLVALLCAVFTGTAWGAESVCYTLTPASGSNNGYANNCDITIDGITWNLTGNSQQIPWRIGGKSLSNVDRTLYSKTALSDNVTKIEVTHGAASSITVNSWTVVVAKDADFANVVSTLTPTFAANATTTITKPTGADWSNCYYKFVYNVTVSGSSNKYLEFSKAEFYSETSSTLDESDLTITGAPVELSFDLYNNKEAQTVNFTTSSTGAVTVSESEYVSTTISDNSIIVTPMKVTPSTQTITVSQAADETYAAGTVTFTVTITDSTPIVATNWQKTSLADLSANDIFVIVGNNGSNFALSNDKGTSSAPSAVEVTVSGDYLTGDIAGNIKWNVSGNATDGYTFYPNGSTATWLYCTNSNNGVRVGDNSSKTFKVVDDYLQHVGTSRYVGIYNSSDWRCYTSINANIEKQTFSFYKYVGAPVPSITAEDVEIAYNATSGSISYTVENPVDGGELTATDNADWLELGTVGETVSFTASENQLATARTAEVVLTYSYGEGLSVTKTVTITQTGDPNVVDEISDITETGKDYAIRGTIVAKCARGLVFGDGTGYVYYYLGSAPDYNVGDIKKISGTMGSYNHVFQFTSPATIEDAESSNYQNTPAVTVVDATSMAAYSDNLHLSDYVQFEGTLVKSGNYYNIQVEGLEKDASISYPTDDQKTALDALENKKVIVKGYFAGVSGGHFSVVLESILSDTPQPETIKVSVNALATDGNKFYSTLYYSDKNLKIPAGITASGVSVNGKSLVMDPVLAKDDVIAKGNAVLLTADAAVDYEFTVVADTEVDATISWDANLLRGNDEEATTEGGDVYYQLSRNANKDANSIGFYWGAADGGAFNNKAHRAYLAVTTEQAGGAKGFAFNDMATGIKSIAADTENGNAIIYNLAGQRVSNAQKGIYIVNGKKVVIR